MSFAVNNACLKRTTGSNPAFVNDTVKFCKLNSELLICKKIKTYSLFLYTNFPFYIVGFYYLLIIYSIF